MRSYIQLKEMVIGDDGDDGGSAEGGTGDRHDSGERDKDGDKKHGTEFR